jgi:hypothetical protein
MSEDVRKLIAKQTAILGLIRCINTNYKNLPKASVTLRKTMEHLSDLETVWEKAQLLDSRITFAATAEDRKKQSYFQQDEFLTVEDAYSKAADHLQEAMSNFVAAGDGSTDSAFRGATSLRLPRVALSKFSGKFSEWEK